MRDYRHFANIGGKIR